MAKTEVLHNPACGTSRRLLADLAERGVEVEVIEYLKTPLDAAQIKALLSQLDGDLSEVVRKDKRFGELGLDKNDYVTAASISRLLVQHPELMQRPILRKGSKAVIARPIERGVELLGL
ncbi:MAG: arsenate reductase [Acidimicrobiia bacterium]|nr:arsenate reductase [Acidimicrobiia bacterium]